MFFDRVAPSVFVAVLLFACGDSNVGTPGNLTIGTPGTILDGGSGTNGYLASGQCPPVGSSICPHDPPATQNDYDQCSGQLIDMNCGAQFKTYLECAGKNVTCDSSGQSDSNAIQAACGDEAQDFTNCEGFTSADGG